MNDIRIFNNEEFGNIRTVEINGKPYFCGSDIASALGYKRPNDAISAHCRATVKHSIRISGKMQDVNFISEGDLYRLITHSKLESAERFEVWVFDEVLPTIRKTGGYVNNDELFLNTYLPYADESTRLIFAQTLKTVREQNETIKQQKAEIMHKEDVIIGLVDNIDLATKRQRITQIVRYGANGNYQERYNLLYSEFEKKYHCNLKMRMSNCEARPKIKNKMDYIDREMGMIPQLYEIACKLFENDVDKLKSEWESIVS